MTSFNAYSDQSLIDIADLAESPSVSRWREDRTPLELAESQLPCLLEDDTAAAAAICNDAANLSTDAAEAPTDCLPEVGSLAESGCDAVNENFGVRTGDSQPIEIVDLAASPAVSKWRTGQQPLLTVTLADNDNNALPLSSIPNPEVEKRSSSIDSDDFCSCASSADVEESVLSLQELESSPRSSIVQHPEVISERPPSLYLNAVEDQDENVKQMEPDGVVTLNTIEIGDAVDAELVADATATSGQNSLEQKTDLETSVTDRDELIADAVDTSSDVVITCNAVGNSVEFSTCVELGSDEPARSDQVEQGNELEAVVNDRRGLELTPDSNTNVHDALADIPVIVSHSLPPTLPVSGEDANCLIDANVARHVTVVDLESDPPITAANDVNESDECYNESMPEVQQIQSVTDSAADPINLSDDVCINRPATSQLAEDCFNVDGSVTVDEARIVGDHVVDLTAGPVDLRPEVVPSQSLPPEVKSRMELVEFSASPFARKPRIQPQQGEILLGQRPREVRSDTDNGQSIAEQQDIELTASSAVPVERTTDDVASWRRLSDSNNNVDVVDGKQDGADRSTDEMSGISHRQIPDETVVLKDSAEETLQALPTMRRDPVEKKAIITGAEGTNRVREQAQNIDRRVISGQQRGASTYNAPAKVAASRRLSMAPGNKASRRTDYDPSSATGIRNSSNFAEFQLTDTERQWLLRSAKCDYQAMARLLVDYPALAVFRDPITGRTALHWAAQNGKPDIIKLVLGTPVAKASMPPFVNCRSRDAGLTPLHVAAAHAKHDVIELLTVVYGADREPMDFSGRRPISYLMASATSNSGYRVDLGMVDNTYSNSWQRSATLLQPAKANPLLLHETASEFGPSSFASKVLSESFGVNRQVSSRVTASNPDQRSAGSMSTVMRGLSMTTAFGPSIAASGLHVGTAGGLTLPPRDLPAVTRRQTVTSLKLSNVGEEGPMHKHLLAPGLTAGGRGASGDTGYLSDGEQVAAAQRKARGEQMKGVDSSPNLGTLV